MKTMKNLIKRGVAVLSLVLSLTTYSQELEYNNIIIGLEHKEAHTKIYFTPLDHSIVKITIIITVRGIKDPYEIELIASHSNVDKEGIITVICQDLEDNTFLLYFTKKYRYASLSRYNDKGSRVLIEFY